MSKEPLNILISGAGIAGATLALCLARQPHLEPKPNITLIERAPKPRTTGQAIDIRGPGVNVIRRMGIEQKIKAKHTTETGICFVDQAGNTVAKFDATGDTEHQTATSEFEILRGELTELLLDEVQEANEKENVNINVVYGETIATLKEEDDGVQISFTNGMLEAQKFDVVAAADGVSSQTRPMMLDQYKDGAEVNPSGMYIAFFTAPRLEHDKDIWSWFTAPSGLAAHLRPHRNKTTMGAYLAVTNSKSEGIPEVDAALSKNVAAQKALLHERFANVDYTEKKRMLEAMDQSEDFYMQQVARVLTSKWTSSRCALIGDSAYAVMGMGTSLAMIGAYMVAGELSKVQTNSAAEISAALQRYEDGMKPFATKCQKMPNGVLQLANPQTTLGVGVLRSVLRFVYWTGLGKLLSSDRWQSDEKWQLPDYGWEGAKTEKS
ncbi:hypothetical protein BDV96DRAFT_521918 [Lophiotrema nucula]|uniref:FAD-binding domain-containing protein n=1 Tax=Lophiotrema nucula TaxID=690887 RepID=A0A6A5Z7F3_9PLEO|nr:hypothetical protein BDV96DRAFT_521918 [Lophiotrema nucula]